MFLSFLSNICDFSFESNKIFAKYKGKIIVNKKPKSPGEYKMIYNYKCRYFKLKRNYNYVYS